MPDVPAHPQDILAAAANRAGVVARHLAALRSDLAASTRHAAADPAAHEQGLALLAAAAAALAAVADAPETLDPAVAPAAPPEETETQDHG